MRDQIAVAAMQSFIQGGGYDKWEYIAQDAYKMADAMIEVMKGGVK
jgi:hypothetical protein